MFKAEGRYLGSARSSSAVAQGTRGCFWQSCCHTPHKWSHSSFTNGSKNICWIIKGSHSTAYVLARLFDSLKSFIWSCFDQGEKQMWCLHGCQTPCFWGHWWYLWRHTGVGEPPRGARAGMGSHMQQSVRSGRAALQATTALCWCPGELSGELGSVLDFGVTCFLRGILEPLSSSLGSFHIQWSLRVQGSGGAGCRPSGLALAILWYSCWIRCYSLLADRGLQDNPSLIFKYCRGKKTSNKSEVTMNSEVKSKMVLWQLLLLFNMLSWEWLSNPVQIPQVGRIVPGRCTTRVQLTVQQKYSFCLRLYSKFFSAICLAVQLTGTPLCKASNSLGFCRLALFSLLVL